MVDMWMLSVAAVLMAAEEESAALTRLTEAVRAVPGLGDALDAARAADESDRIARAEILADGLKAAYAGDGEFAALLDELWPEVLFGPRPKRPRTVNMVGTVHGGAKVIQLGDFAGTIDLSSPPPAGSPADGAPSPARPRFPFFGARKRR